MPGIGFGIISATVVQLDRAIGVATPHDQFPSGPNPTHLRAGRWSIHGGHWAPTISSRIITSAIDAVSSAEEVWPSAPDNHFLAGPNRRVKPARGRCAVLRDWPPGVGPQIMDGAIIEKRTLPATAEDD